MVKCHFRRRARNRVVVDHLVVDLDHPQMPARTLGERVWSPWDQNRTPDKNVLFILFAFLLLCFSFQIPLGLLRHAVRERFGLYPIELDFRLLSEENLYRAYFYKRQVIVVVVIPEQTEVYPSRHGARLSNVNSKTTFGSHVKYVK